MLTNCSENEKLFAKSVPVSIKDVCTDQLRATHLFLTMEWQYASTGLFGSKVLIISLTDNNDPFFLYNLHLSEEDFQMLKNNQGVKIDFASFPQYIIDYIDKCLVEEKSPQPKFLLIFTVNDKLGNSASTSQLEIVQTLQFKNLTHFFLKFIPATDSAVRQYLVSSFRNLKEEKNQLLIKVACLEHNVTEKTTSLQQVLNSKVQELEILRKESNVELSMKESKYIHEIQDERNRLQNRLKETEDRFEAELNEKEQHFRRQIKQLEIKVSSLESLNKELHTKCKKQESTIREQKSNILSCEDEIRRLKDNSHSYMLKCDNLSLELRDKELYIRQQDKKVDDLEQDLQSKRQNITRLKEQIDLDLKQKQRLEVDLENAKLQHEMSEKTVEVLRGDIRKQNDVIIKLQKKVKDGNERIKDKSNHCVKLEMDIEEKSKLLHDLQIETSEMKVLLEDKDNDITNLNASLNSIHQRIKELESLSKNQQDVMKYLHHQLTNHGIVPTSTQLLNLEPSPSSVAQKELEKINSRKSLGNSDSSPANILNSVIPKIVRDTTSSGRKCMSTPYHQQVTGGIDSAYYTDPSSSARKLTPANSVRKNNADFNSEALEIDPAALSAAFGNSTPKTSTAKKQTNLAHKKLQRTASLKSSVSKNR